MIHRRDFIKTAFLGAGASFLGPNVFGRPTINGKPPMRFIFVHKGNGLFPDLMVPPTLSSEQKAIEKSKDAFQVALADHELPPWMEALNEHKENLTILQGLSGKMCTTGHHTWQSSLGVYKANERLSSVKWATVDFELAKLNPSPMEHIELACFPSGGGNSRGNINGIERGFSARGAQQPNYAFGSPKVAMEELFKTVSEDESQRIRYQLESRMLEFAAQNESGLAEHLRGLERRKITNYSDSIQSVRQQAKKLEAMSDVIRKHAPELDPKYFADELMTTDRQWGHTEILLSTLISGMTNVVTFTVDELGTPYTGLPDIEKATVNLHDVGHNKPVDRLSALEVRERVRRQHMSLLDTIVSRLKSVPEAGGTMFDNTMVFYFPDNGETHHSKGTEYPFIVLSGRNSKLNIAGNYIRLPRYGTDGHRTLGNWYTTLLNAYGNPIEHYGDYDLALSKMGIDQSGPIKEFMMG